MLVLYSSYHLSCPYRALFPRESTEDYIFIYLLKMFIAPPILPSKVSCLCWEIAANTSELQGREGIWNEASSALHICHITYAFFPQLVMQLLEALLLTTLSNRIPFPIETAWLFLSSCHDIVPGGKIANSTKKYMSENCQLAQRRVLLSVSGTSN